MLRRILIALAALFIAQPAYAATCGSSTVPADIPSTGGADCTTVTPQYDTTNSVQNGWLDQAVNPNPQTGLANIPVPSYTNRVTTLVVPERSGNGVSCTSFGLVVGAGGDSSCAETKFRTFVDFSHYGPDDPIRNFGSPGTSHLHCFFGNGSTNAYSTYKSLRKRGLTSTAIGTDVNATAYWYPCITVANYDGAGHTGIVKPDSIVVYYVGDGSTPTTVANVEKSTLLVPGLRYVFGFNMDDGGKPTDPDHGIGAWLLNGSTGVLDAANAANAAAGGSSTRYATVNAPGSQPPGMVDYVCMGSTVDASVQSSSTFASKFLQTLTGGDPYNGTCEAGFFTGSASGGILTVTAVSSGVLQVGQSILNGTNSLGDLTITSQRSSTESGGALGGRGTYSISKTDVTATYTNVTATHQFFIGISGAQCWDGRNLWTPGGYKHVVPIIFDAKYGVMTCPNNYYHIPAIHLEIGITQYGWADRQRWNLSSDAGARTRLSCSTSACPPGFTFHTDWMHGWDMVKGAEWMRKCFGAEHNTPHQCAISQINGTEELVGHYGCGASNRCPQVDPTSLPRINATDPGWGRVPSAWVNSISGMHMHSN
jgi:hypothetical protein